MTCLGCKRRQEILSRWLDNVRSRSPRLRRRSVAAQMEEIGTQIAAGVSPVEIALQQAVELGPAEEVQDDRCR